MRKKRRWWLIVLIVVVVVAAATTAALLLLDRNKSTGVHYLTSTATTRTIAQTVQADFTLASARDSMTISLSGTGSASSSSNSSAAATTTSATTARGAVTTVSDVAGASSAAHKATAAGAGAGAVGKAITTAGAIVTARAITVAGTSPSASTPEPTPTATPSPAFTSFAPTSGPVGARVTLTGSGLTSTTTVSFSGSAATFKVVSDTQVTATVPAGAVSGPITVTTAGGTATSTGRFTVTRKSEPTPTPSPSRSGRAGGGGASGGSSYGSRSSTGTTASTSGSTTSSASSSASSGTSGVVTGIALAAGRTPRTLEHLLTISGKPIYAFVSPTPLYTTLSTSLSTGAQRSNVAALQHALKDDGYFTGTINGDFGTTTKTALEDWQSAHGLTKTGEITTSQFVWVPKGATLASWNVSLGGSVGSTTALATIDYPRELIAEALVTQADISSLKVGQKATLTIDGETSDPFTGTITSIASAARLVRLVGRLVEHRRVHGRRCPAKPAGARQVGHDRFAHGHDRQPQQRSGGADERREQQLLDVVRARDDERHTHLSPGHHRSCDLVAHADHERARRRRDGRHRHLHQLGDEHQHEQRLRRLRRVQRRWWWLRPPLEQRLDHGRVGRRRSMTVFLESLRLAFSSLRANPLRAVLTILGIVIGVAAVVALTSIGSGSTRAVENRFNAFGTDTITVQTSQFSSNATPYRPATSPPSTTLRESRRPSPP